VPNEKPLGMHRDWQPLGYVSSWGGMEVGTGMMYPVSVVDGLVHQLGGWKLEMECALHRARANLRSTLAQQDERTTADAACPVGQAIVTKGGNEALSSMYDMIVHTTPPFYKHHDSPERLLLQCYRSSLSRVDEMSDTKSSGSSTEPVRVAVPLIGSGARGFPFDAAIDVASRAAVEWYCDGEKEGSKGGTTLHRTLAIGVLERELANELVEAIDEQLQSRCGG
jgi:O-acetyl-ADP-ribose deacetylase (regulator of RNase III)